MMHSLQPLKPLEVTFLADICKALAHPARIRILKHLLNEGRCLCGRIVEILPLAQSTVSQHLKILKEARLILGETEGQKTCYCANRKVLARFNGFLGTMLDNGNGRNDA